MNKATERRLAKAVADFEKGNAAKDALVAKLSDQVEQLTLFANQLLDRATAAEQAVGKSRGTTKSQTGIFEGVISKTRAGEQRHGRLPGGRGQFAVTTNPRPASNEHAARVDTIRKADEQRRAATLAQLAAKRDTRFGR